MADIKWSAFPSGGAIVAGDQTVGLRAGANVRLTANTFGNLSLSTNTVSSTNTNGNINIAPNGTGVALIGSSTSVSTTSRLQVSNPGSGTGVLVSAYQNAASAAALFNMNKSRSTTIGSFTTVQNGDTIGSLLWQADDGTTFKTTAAITATVSGSVSTGVVPCQLTLRTTNTSGTVTTALTISNAQIVTLANALPVTSGGTGLTSTTANQLLYSSATSTIAGLATANNGILVTSNAGAPSISSTLPSGIAATNMALTTPTLGAASATSLSFSSTSGIIGTTTNDSAAAGSVGQYAETVVPFASRFSVATNTAVNTTSISLTAGDWDVWGNQGYFTGAGTIVVDMSAWVSATSATQPDLSLIASVSLGTGIVICATGNAGYNLTIPMQRFRLATTTTIYLSSYNNFSVSTLLAYGAINARRRR